MSEHLPEMIPARRPAPSEPAPLEPEPSRPPRRTRRRLFRAALIFAGALAPLLVLAVVWLHTGFGERRLGKLVEDELRGVFQGELRVREIRVGGFLRICADGVELKDPAGSSVIRADSVCLRVQPLALEAHRVLLREVRIERPRIDIATVAAPSGEPTTTLARALASRAPPGPPQESGPFTWVIDARDLQLRGGSLRIRPAPGANPTFALEEVAIDAAHARYAADGAVAQLEAKGRLLAPGEAGVSLRADAQLAGGFRDGKVELRALSAQLGQSGFSASGGHDLRAGQGELKLRDLVVDPHALAVLLGSAPIASEVRGEVDLRAQGGAAALSARLSAGGGTLVAQARAALERNPSWSAKVEARGVDPGAVVAAAPHGTVTAQLDAKGKGLPEFGAHGVRGELEGRLHVGPARIERVGPVVADLDARVEGKKALVRAFTAKALGLEVRARGSTARDALALDLQVDALKLAEVGRAIGAAMKGPSLPLAGEAHLVARLTGTPRKPDAQVHLRSSHVRFADRFHADDLAVDGNLAGALRAPDGTLTVVAKSFVAGQLDLGAPRIDVQLRWPWAHLRIDAGVASGRLELAGDARIDDDKDGLSLSDFIVGWPGNRLRLAHDTRIHFRAGETVIEPLELLGEHGSLRLSARLTPARIEGAMVVTRFDLSRLPDFAVPPELGLRGTLDGDLVVSGPSSRPDLDLKLDLQGASVRRFTSLSADGHTRAHLHGGRLRTEGFLTVPRGPELRFEADAPLSFTSADPQAAPIHAQVTLAKLDLAQLAEQAQLERLLRLRLQGRVELRAVATGNLAAPRATLSLAAHDLATNRIQRLDAQVGLVLDKGRAALDGSVLVGGEQAVGFTGETAIDLLRAMRDGRYLAGALERPIEAKVAVSRLPLARLAQAGALPKGSEGTVTAALRVFGTPLAPQISLAASGDAISSGRIRDLNFETSLSVEKQVHFSFGARSASEVLANLESTLGLDGAELVELVRRHGEADAVSPLLDRPLSLSLEVPGLVIGRIAQLSGAGGKLAAEGRLEGRVTLTGSLARPQLKGHLAIEDVVARQHKLGSADLYLEGDSKGALLHLGINPPGGGVFLGHATLRADLGAHSLLRSGVSAVLGGELSGDLEAKKLDLAFLSGLVPSLRRAAGTLDGGVKVDGLFGRPRSLGSAHLRSASFDVVGQGIFEDVGLDATFSPKEIVVDRLTGSLDAGTFAAVLVAGYRPAPGAQEGERLEFSAEVHLGDEESVRDRKDARGQPVRRAPLPIRQAGEQRAEVEGELDLFGNFNDGLLNVNAKIPDAKVRVRQLPDKSLPNLDPAPDVLIVHPGERPHPPGKEPEEVEAEERERREAQFRLHAHLELQRLYVTASDFEFPVRSDLNFDYDARHPDHPKADGTITVPSGSFSALGRRFSIQEAKITETGGDITDPELDIKAKFENPKATVTIAIAGTAKDPQIDLSSNPPMDQDAIAFFLATGRSEPRAVQNGGSIDLQGAATSVLGGLLFGELRKTLAGALPVDVITIEAQGKGVAQASVGKYIGDRIFVGYRQRLIPAPGENTNEGRIEYEINRGIAAEATIGEKNQDVSILYTRDF